MMPDQLPEPWMSQAEATILEFVQRRQLTFAEAKSNWPDGHADDQIEANLAVADALATKFAKNPARAILDPDSTMWAVEQVLKGTHPADHVHHAYLAYGEYLGFVQGVLAAFDRVSSQSPG
jgi:hypothetical protein